MSHVDDFTALGTTLNVRRVRIIERPIRISEHFAVYPEYHGQTAGPTIAYIRGGRESREDAAEAFAAVFAAAPDLLAVLKKALNAQVSQFSNPAQFQSWLALISREAIAKAERHV